MNKHRKTIFFMKICFWIFSRINNMLIYCNIKIVLLLFFKIIFYLLQNIFEKPLFMIFILLSNFLNFKFNIYYIFETNSKIKI